MKKMKTKRLLAVLLTLAMVLGMTIISSADVNDGKDLNASTTEPKIVKHNAEGTADDRATISVGGLSATSGGALRATAYPIITAEYNNPGNVFSKYEVVYKNVDPAITLPASAGAIVDITEKNLSAILTEIRRSNPAPEGYSMTITDGVAKAEVPVGSYLVVIEGGGAIIYSPVVASLYYVTETDASGNVSNAIAGGGIVDIALNQAWAKKTTPTVEKFIVEGGEDKKGNTVNIGDIIEYKVVTTPIPYYGGDYPKFQLVDKFGKGLTLVSQSAITVSVSGSAVTTGGIKTLVEHTDYTLTPAVSGDAVTIDFVVNGKYTLNDYANTTDTKIVVTYYAQVTEEANINQDPNTNEVTLKYTPDSFKNEGEEEDKDKVYSYTFDIDGGIEGSVTDRVINKRGDTIDETTGPVTGSGLAGAVFGLYTDESCTTLYTNGSFDGTVTTINGGQMPIKGLKEGIYYLKEIQAPDKYSLNTNVYKIEIKTTPDPNAEKGEKGKISKWEIFVNDLTVASGTVSGGAVASGGAISTGFAKSSFTINQGTATGGAITVTPEIQGTDIMNTKLTGLPSTGGIGTTIFTIAGCLIMILAAALFFASRRKTSKK